MIINIHPILPISCNTQCINQGREYLELNKTTIWESALFCQCPHPPHFRDASAAFVDTWALHAAQLVRALHRSHRAAGSIPAEDLYRGLSEYNQTAQNQLYKRVTETGLRIYLNILYVPDKHINYFQIILKCRV